MKFTEALEQLKSGKKLRKPYWKAGVYVFEEDGEILLNGGEPYKISNRDVVYNEDLWEEYKGSQEELFLGYLRVLRMNDMIFEPEIRDALEWAIEELSKGREVSHD